MDWLMNWLSELTMIMVANEMNPEAVCSRGQVLFVSLMTAIYVYEIWIVMREKLYREYAPRPSRVPHKRRWEDSAWRVAFSYVMLVVICYAVWVIMIQDQMYQSK